jgi:type IV secretory pathway VirJ component
VNWTNKRIALQTAMSRLNAMVQDLGTKQTVHLSWAQSYTATWQTALRAPFKPGGGKTVVQAHCERAPKRDTLEPHATCLATQALPQHASGPLSPGIPQVGLILPMYHHANEILLCLRHVYSQQQERELTVCWHASCQRRQSELSEYCEDI